jgi:hypothetical protein
MKARYQKMVKNSPPGMDAVHSCYGRRFSFATYKTLALVITFWCYCLFHATRKPPSVVKRCAALSCSNLQPDAPTSSVFTDQ